MSIEVRTQEPLASADSQHALAIPSRSAIQLWRRRRYQATAALLAVLVVAALAANNYLARLYSPEGAVRQYLSALQSGDPASAWSAMQVSASSGAATNLIDRAALDAAFATSRSDIKSFAVTSTRSLNSSTAAVALSYETSAGTKNATFVVRRSGESNLGIYPRWQVAVAPVILQINLPVGSGGVLVDGKRVDVRGKGSIAVLPVAHQLRFPGTSMVQPQTIKLDAFSGAAQTVVYQAALTPTGIDKATAAIKTAFAACAHQTATRPTDCPQSVGSGVAVNSGTWQVVGDPSTGVVFSVDSSSNLVGSGHYQLVFSYSYAGIDGTVHVPSAGGYQAILNLAADDIGVTSIKAASGLPAVPRPASATDQAVEAVVAPALKACASLTSGNPGACPQLFIFPDSSDYHWTLITDPLLDARVSYDPDTGLFTVKGDFSMKLNYKIRGFPYTTYSTNTTYVAYLFWDGQQLVLVTIDGE